MFIIWYYNIFYFGPETFTLLSLRPIHSTSRKFEDDVFTPKTASNVFGPRYTEKKIHHRQKRSSAPP